MPGEDDPVELEKFWTRLRGARPKSEPPKPVGPVLPLQEAPDLSGDVWAARVLVRNNEETYGPRVPVAKKHSAGVAVQLDCRFPPLTFTCQVSGVVIWESQIATKPMARANFDSTYDASAGDALECTVSVTL